MGEQPSIAGVSHVSLSVRDLDRSLGFYRDVLRLPVVRGPYDGEVFEGRQAMVLAGRVMVSLQQHAANDGDAFDPRRTGLDHLAFHVRDQRELASWRDDLDAAGVANSGVMDVGGFGWMIEFRDPDGVQLELFATR